MVKTSNIKKIIESTPIINLIPRIIRLLLYARAARNYRALHNNSLFYPLSPSSIIGIMKAFQALDKSCKGKAYYEFGLFKGFSFWFAEQISREYMGPEFVLYGFDSFQGLPKSKVDIDPIYWAEGNYSATLDFVTKMFLKNGTDFSRIKLFKNFFSKDYFDHLKNKEEFKQPAICMIDSDIYESCVFALDFIKEYLVPGTILLFDDYNAFDKDDNHGERKALKEFEIKNPSFQKKHLFDFGWHGIAFKVIRV